MAQGEEPQVPRGAVRHGPSARGLGWPLGIRDWTYKQRPAIHDKGTVTQCAATGPGRWTRASAQNGQDLVSSGRCSVLSLFLTQDRSGEAECASHTHPSGAQVHGVTAAVAPPRQCFPPQPTSGLGHRCWRGRPWPERALKERPLCSRAAAAGWPAHRHHPSWPRAGDVASRGRRLLGLAEPRPVRPTAVPGRQCGH